MNPTLCSITLATTLAAASAAARELRFPADAVADVRRDYGAVGDGVADDTAAIQRALDEGRNLIYLPHGTYQISDTLRWRRGEGQNPAWKRQILQGQSETGTVVRLRNHALGFQDPTLPKALVWTGKAPAQRFRNGLRNLTLDTGVGNPGAIGAQFMANNQGGIHHVTIRSGDGGGPIGLDLGYSDEQGPCLVRHVTVRGFDVGIRTDHAVDSVVFEHITLEGQRAFGLDNRDQCLSIRGLRSRNRVPALRNTRWGVVAILDSDLAGVDGAAAAIVNDAQLFARNVSTPGYGNAMVRGSGAVVASGPQIGEYASSRHALFDAPPRSLNLPIEETPDVPWDDPAAWASVADFGPPRSVTLVHRDGETTQEWDPARQAPVERRLPPEERRRVVEDWSEALQRAIDSGATTVYFPGGGSRTYGLFGSVRLRGAVRRIIGCEAPLGSTVKHTHRPTDYQDEARCVFIVEDGDAPVVVLERFDSWYASPRIEQRSKRRLVVSSLSVYELLTTPGGGDVFLEDIRAKLVTVDGSRLWARQLNVEGSENPRILNRGGQTWVLGTKTEGAGTVGAVSNGGASEYLGGFAYGNRAPSEPNTMFRNGESSLSVTIGEWRTRKGSPFAVLVEETQRDETRRLLSEHAPPRGQARSLPLYSGIRRPTWPSATLSNAHVRLTAYAPDAGSGYYQAARFDWSSLLGDLDIGGRRFFVRHHAGKHNPRGHDHVAGPAEEFDMEGSPPGFAEAGPGEPFLKVGVGVLRRPDAKAYSFGRDYEIVDHGAWTFTPVGSTSVVYRHDVALPGGRHGYVLERRLSLAADGAGLRIGRSLRNTGAEPLRTRHYAHNFVRIDDHPIGRDYRLEFAFDPRVVKPETMPAAGVLDGQSLGFLPEVLERTFWVCLGRFDTTPEHNRVTVRHVPSGAAVSFATDRPLADLRIYANARILCPEPFVDLDLAPGETEEWHTQITFCAGTRPIHEPSPPGGTAP